MAKKSVLLFVTVVTCICLYAQNVDQGKKYLYYQRYLSAKNGFEGVLARDPNNLEAT